MKPQKLVGYIIVWRPSGASMYLVPSPRGGRTAQIKGRPLSVLAQTAGRATLFSNLALAKQAVLRTIRFYTMSYGTSPGLAAVNALIKPENFSIVNVYAATTKPKHYLEEVTDENLQEECQDG